jgi:V8-like Glu-specific endopeptidase
MFRLTQEFGAQAGRQLVFTQERVRIGRQPGNDVVLDANIDLDASGNHCEVVREQGQWVLVDLNSRNGTYVNSVRVTRQYLKQGDVFECGRGGPRFRFELQTQAAVNPAPNPFQSPVHSVSNAPYASSPAPFGAAPIAAPGPASYNAPQSNVGYPQTANANGALGPSAHHQPSVGAAVAAKLPQGATVGKNTIALMINQAVAANEQQREARGTGTKLLFVVGALVCLSAVGGVIAFVATRESTTNNNGNNGNNAGELISQRDEGAIYLLAAQVPGTPHPRGYCTGFSITPNLIATNAHCIDAARQFLDRGATLVALQSSGRGTGVPLTPVYRDSRFSDAQYGADGSGFDVGLMRASATLPKQVTVASNETLLQIRSGSQVFVFGFPGLTMNESSPVATITQGVLNRMTDFFVRAADPASAQRLQHSAQTTSGSSGSPIFSAAGEVIGINAGSLSDEERQRILDPRTGQTMQVEVNRSSNFKYGMRADIIRAAVAQVGETLP